MAARKVTIFAIPKPFRRETATAQRNSIQSWMRLLPAPRIILMGDDEGVAATAQEFGLEYEPRLERNEFGTPLLSSAFARAHERVDDGLLLFVNSDIILTSGISEAIRRAPEGDFLMAGQRTNLYVRQPLDFGNSGWEADLGRRVAAKGIMSDQTAIDYFIFPHHMFAQVPRFAVGRGWWDHWLLREALRTGAKLIDLTPSVLAVHQRHDYLAGEEGIRNLALYGGPSPGASLAMANLVLENGALRRPHDMAGMRKSGILRRVMRRLVHASGDAR